MITVYAESTPNPSAMKFVASQMLAGEHIEEYFSAAETGNCKLAARLFEYPFVKSVFITANFISVHKTDDIEWFEVHNEIRQVVSDILNSDEPLFLKRESIEKPVSDSKFEISDAISDEKPQISNSPSSGSIDEQISHLLDEYVRPAVEGDGGAIQFKSYDAGKVTVTLRGACSGCPSSTVTLKSGIETLLKQMLPGKVTEVVAEEL